jgi:hypothetical protein
VDPHFAARRFAAAEEEANATRRAVSLAAAVRRSLARLLTKKRRFDTVPE